MQRSRAHEIVTELLDDLERRQGFGVEEDLPPGEFPRLVDRWCRILQVEVPKPIYVEPVVRH